MRSAFEIRLLSHGNRDKSHRIVQTYAAPTSKSLTFFLVCISFDFTQNYGYTIGPQGAKQPSLDNVIAVPC